MRRIFRLTLTLFGISAASFSQVGSSDPQTLQAILTEVRALRQDLHTSLARVQSSQMLLYRLQRQPTVVGRASDPLDDARSKLSGIQAHQRAATAGLKRLEGELSAEQNLQQQKLPHDRIKPIKSDLENDRALEQDYRTAELEREIKRRSSLTRQHQISRSCLNSIGTCDHHVSC